MVYKDASQPVERRVSDLLGRMTLEEKAEQLASVWVYELLEKSSFSAHKAESRIGNGIGQITRIGGATVLRPAEAARVANQIQKYLVERTRLGIPAIVHEECCSGLMMRGATLFPQAIGVAASWNPELVRQMGDIIRRQGRRMGAHHTLAPVLDVTRDPRWGRTEETMGEDPYLVARMGTSYVQGLQGRSWTEGLVATAKHFVGYGNSEGGMNWAPAHIPERELREVFLFPFEAAVRAGRLASVMNSYAELDGIPCATNPWLFRELLEREWGFEGVVVSDYFAINMIREYHHAARDKAHAAAQALEAGIDVELPTKDCYSAPLLEAVRSGAVSEGLVDDSLRRVLRMKFLLGLFEHPYVSEEGVDESFDTSEDRAVSLRLAEQSIVLLENRDDVLPLSPDTRKVAVIGPNAAEWRNMIGDYAYPAHIETLKAMKESDPFGTPVPDEIGEFEDFVPVTTILDGVKAAFSAQTEVTYARGCDVIDEDRSGFAQAVEAAKQADVAICVFGDRSGLVEGCTSGEARDRSRINLPGVQEELLQEVSATGTPVVLVLVNARPVELQWASEHIPAILAVWFPGEEGGTAVANALVGKTAPGGKLPISFPRGVGQIPVYHYHKPSGGRSHWLGDYVDLSASPLYPFGHGLSYTKFEYRSMELDRQTAFPGETLEVRVVLRNAGKRYGEEVVQLYLHDAESTITRPVKELKGFRRVGLDAGAETTVTFALAVNQLGFYEEAMRYVVEPGEFEVMAGSSSADIRLTTKLEVVSASQRPAIAKSYFSTASVDQGA